LSYETQQIVANAGFPQAPSEPTLYFRKLMRISHMVKYIKRRCLLLFFGTFFLPLYAAETAPALLAMEGNKIVTAAGVRMRAAISLDAKVLDKPALGTVVKATKRTRKKVRTGSVTGYWYYVTYLSKKGRKQGWVFGSLLGDFRAGKEDATHWALVQQRSIKKRADFADYAQLYQYISTILPSIKNTDIQANLALEQLLSLQKAAEKISYDKEKIKPYSLFLANHKKNLFYDEISGRYLIPSERYATLSERYAQSAEGDKLAWFAANAPTGGECEGELECVFMRMTMQEGIYLQHYTDGNYAKEALTTVSDILTYMINALRTAPKEYDYLRFKELKKEQQTLLKVLKQGKTVPALRQKVLKQLHVLPTVMKP
jgi:hypothetical protein